MSERRLSVSFSGGETSALMAILIKEKMSHEYDDIRFVFANTGQENEETLEFAHKVDKRFGLGLVWIEADVNPEYRKGTRAKIVTYETANRTGAPFEAGIAKYGLPNQDFPFCTRELKTTPMRAWLRSIGWQAGTYDVAIGIRDDEGDRMSPTYKKDRIIYPLIQRWKFTKPMVNEFWSQQSFRLPLKGYEGNCQ